MIMLWWTWSIPYRLPREAFLFPVSDGKSYALLTGSGDMLSWLLNAVLEKIFGGYCLFERLPKALDFGWGEPCLVDDRYTVLKILSSLVNAKFLYAQRPPKINKMKDWNEPCRISFRAQGRDSWLTSENPSELSAFHSRSSWCCSRGDWPNLASWPRRLTSNDWLPASWHFSWWTFQLTYKMYIN